MWKIDLAKKLMKVVERHPQFSEQDVGELNEVFNHKAFLGADDASRMRMMLISSQSKYQSELDYPWDNYFGFDMKPLLVGKHVLDLGCFTGGRSIAWFEKYELGSIAGVDINDVYIEAAEQFAEKRNALSEFTKGTGESLPYENDSFDAVMSYDVFEHVQDVGDALAECHRILKPGGRLFVVFPSYYQPIEHHLTLVTMTPCLHWIFSGQTLVRAYCEILDERGEDVYWYKRESDALQPWEKGHTINGMTFARFKKIISSQEWRVFREVHRPVGAIGRSVEGNALAKLLSVLFFPLTYVPGLQEMFLHRNTFILEKQ